jgi:hypothetical protein
VTALAFVFKLTKLAERHWRRLNGSGHLAEIIESGRFRDTKPPRTPRAKPLPGPPSPNLMGWDGPAPGIKLPQAALGPPTEGAVRPA